MLGCFEVLITAGEIILRVVLILFIPVFLCGTINAIGSGAVGDPCVLGIILFWGVVILVAGARAFG